MSYVFNPRQMILDELELTQAAILRILANVQRLQVKDKEMEEANLRDLQARKNELMADLVRMDNASRGRIRNYEVI